MTKEEFATKIKSKYPEYQSVDTNTLVNKIVEKYPVYENQITDYSKPQKGVVQDIKQAGRGIVDSFKKGGEKVTEAINAYSTGEQDLASTALQAIGAGAGAVSGAGGEIVKGAVKAVLPQGVQEDVGGVLKKAGTAVASAQPVQDIMARYEQLKIDNPEKARDIEAALGIGQLALDVATAGTGKAATAATRKAIVGGVETAATNTRKAVQSAVPKVVESGKDTALFLSGKGSGLQPDTIKYILQNPDQYTEAVKQGVSRSGVANDFFNTVQSKLDNVAETGAQYDPIRQSGATVQFDGNPILKTLESRGFKIVDGNITAGTKSATRDAGQIRELQRLYDNWGSATQLDAEEFLNMRRDIGDLSKFDSTGQKVQVDEAIARDIYGAVNESGSQIPGLRELDDQFAPIKKESEAIKKEFLTKDTDGNYTLKDTAINRIINAKGAGKDNVIERLESYMPGISEKIRVAKVLEDIEYAKGRNVGAYLQGGLVAGGLLTANVPLIAAGLVVANPELLAKLLVFVGKKAKVSAQKAAAIADKVRAGKALTKTESDLVKSIQTISKEELVDTLGGAASVGVEQELLGSIGNSE
jgi:hypothetical protein